MRSRIFFAIILILLMILGIVTVIHVEKNVKVIMKSNCMIFQLNDIMDCWDLQQLCTNENCTYYFELRINKSYESLEKCEDYLK